MDPTACYYRWLGHYVESERCEQDDQCDPAQEALSDARDAANDLVDWLHNGGFQPAIEPARYLAFLIWCGLELQNMHKVRTAGLQRRALYPNAYATQED